MFRRAYLVALGRSRGTRLKHSSRKSTPSGDRSSGMGGGLLLLAMWNSADTWLPNSLQGGFPGAEPAARARVLYEQTVR